MVRARRVFGFVGLVVAFAGLMALTSSAEAQGSQDATLSASVVDDKGSPVAEVVGDLFEAIADGSRGTWLGDRTTGTGGSLSWTTTPGCYVVVLIAPEGSVFAESGNGYLERGACVGAGETFQLLGTLSGEATIGGMVVGPGDGPAAGVVADYFVATADGSRGQWLGAVSTSTDGAYRRALASGCYVIVLIAPPDLTFTATGTAYRELPACLKQGDRVELPVAVLIGDVPCPGPASTNTNQFGPISPFDIVAGSDGNVYTPSDGEIWKYDPVADVGTNLAIAASRLFPGEGNKLIYTLFREDRTGYNIGVFDVVTGEVSLDDRTFPFLTNPTFANGHVYFRAEGLLWSYDPDSGVYTSAEGIEDEFDRELVVTGDGRVVVNALAPELDGRALWVWDPLTNTSTMLDLYNGASYEASGMQVGSDDRIYFFGRDIGFAAVDIDTLEVTEFGYPRASWITAGTDGNLYFTGSPDSSRSSLWQYSPSTNQFRKVFAATSARYYVVGPQGELYFALTDRRFPTELWRWDPTTGNASNFEGANFVENITMGPNNTIYYKAFDGVEVELWSYKTVCQPPTAMPPEQDK